MSCPTCDHTLQKLCDEGGTAHYHCPRCGTHRMIRGQWVNDTVPKVVEYLRSFYRMISDSPEGRALRTLAHIEGITESILKPGDRPGPGA